MGPEALPILTIAQAAGRLYLLGMPRRVAAAAGALGPAIEVVGAALLRPTVRWAIEETDARSSALGQDRRYLYLATDAHATGGRELAAAVAVHDASLGGEIACAGRLPVVPGARVEAVSVR